MVIIVTIVVVILVINKRKVMLDSSGWVWYTSLQGGN